jgi:thioester reductase-like protein
MSKSGRRLHDEKTATPRHVVGEDGREVEVGDEVEVGEPLAGDLVLPGLGLAPEAWTKLSRRVTHIVHSAAELRFDGALEEMRRINVEGTRHLLALARSAHEHHGIARYAHVSTAYVAGGRTGEVGSAPAASAGEKPSRR